MRKIYAAGGQGSKVIAMMVAVAGCVAAMVWWGSDLYQSYGQVPGTGAPGPWGPRFGVMLLVIGLAGLLLFGTMFYGRIYVMSLTWDDERQTLRFRTLLLVFPVTWSVPVADVREATRVDLNSPRGGGGTPFVWVKVEPRRWRPRRFMVDLQGRVLDQPALEQALWGARERSVAAGGERGTTPPVLDPPQPAQLAREEPAQDGSPAGEPDPGALPPAPLRTQIYVLLWFVAALVLLYFTVTLPLTLDNSPGQALRARWWGITGSLFVDDCHDEPRYGKSGRVTMELACYGTFSSADGTFTSEHLTVNKPRWSDAGTRVPASITGASARLAYVRTDPLMWSLELVGGGVGALFSAGLAVKCSWPIREPIQRWRARRRRRR